MQQAKWIPEGSAHPHHVVYVFMDANCPYCRTLWFMLQPYYRVGLQVRNVMVGVISASSPGKAAAIFDSRDPTAALQMNEVRWGHGVDRGGGMTPLRHPSANDLSELADNETLMQAFNLRGTPGIVFADAHGKVYVIPGVPGAKVLKLIVQTSAAL